ncbi:MAG: hypothetical protein B6I34_10875 [Anaerolineaceae bacterium 4572_32.1]|nr:MAG: hypothetical protein B6I34_10875 [Anaerolineaceae bacterium 4572_32.1]RLC69760.1 MAG: nitroreductase [Chloroflexota bacterium]
MLSISKIIIDGVVLSLLASLFIVITIRLNPRIWLRDYPKDIQDKVPPKTQKEKKLSLMLGIPFLILLVAVPFVSSLTLNLENNGNISFYLLFLNAFGVASIFNLVDWLLLDWVMFCTITPKFVVIPGTEGMAGYKDYFYHFRGFLIGTVTSAAAGLIIAGLVSFL